MNKVLLLNSQNEPIHITSWKRAIVLLIKGKAECLEYIQKAEDFIKIDESYVPKTIKLTYTLAVPKLELPISRENILARDNYTCQYCGKKLPANELTIDHVFPKSRFGADIWENLATSCKECNQKKRTELQKKPE
jgi:5-methylcytosine-specific restriction endonuclease McrA